ncbi:MAG: glycosyltransferase [Treponema sp.]|jgi:glycosyltransferase involved in cell wall biosynthesis|nr:glycosyltransferase [Treponema sp.]
MRIFQIVTLSELGGAQVMAAHLSNALAENHEVTVFAGEGDGKLFALLDKRVNYFKIASLVKNVSPLNDIKTLFFFLTLYRRYKPDIIHLHSSKAGILGRLAFPGNRVVYTVHGFDSIRLAYRKFLPLERCLQTRCKAIVAVSHYDEDNLKAEGITRNVSCIYNGIPEPSAGRQETVLPVPEKYKKKILCIARVNKPKRLDLFLETAALLPEYAFIWIGNREEAPDVPENVFLLGNMPDAGSYNRNADVFMLPSNYEGLPVVIIEAMSYGKPVVASAAGGIGELVEDGVNGYISKNTASSFAEKIRTIMENDTLYKTLACNSQDRFRKFFAVEKMTDQYLKVYS